MLRAFTERRDSGQPSPTQEKSKTWVPSSSSKQNGAAKPKSNHKRKSSAKPKVVFKSQMSGPSGSQAPKSKTTAARRASQADPNTTPVSKRHKAFASLLVSFLATSSVAIEPDAADQKTIESANKASSTPVPPAPKKANTRSASVVKPSEIRKTRWKRFKYELGLKMKSGQKGKQKEETTPLTEMELVDMQSQQREQARQDARRVDTA